MNKVRLYLQNHPKLNKVFYFLLFILIVCFLFPFKISPSFINIWELCVLIIGYGSIGLGFTAIYGKNKEGLVYITSLILTVLGMIGRYILEYGEVSNIRDFTMYNIILFLIIIPIYTAIAYHLFIKYGVKKE